MTDVLIAGGGPAGAIAGVVLARAGVRVTILDRARFPRDKLCGDTINPGALGILRRLGLEGAAGGGLPIAGMIVTGEGGLRVVGPYAGGRRGVAIRRSALDARLLAAAAAAGAVVEQGVLVRAPVLSDDGARVTGVEIRTPSGRAERRRAAVTIAADGRFSRIARALSLARAPVRPRRWAVGALFAGVSDVSSFGEMHVRSRWYIGVAPLPGGCTNACVVTASRAALATPALLDRLLRSDPETAGRFRLAERLTPDTSLGPLALDVPQAGMPGLLLAGDAAGFIDPMTGDGLRFAFRGAELAAREALRALAGGWDDAHERLTSTRRREFRGKWAFNRAMRALAASPRGVRLAGAGARVSPAVLRHVIQYAGDVRLS